MLTLEHKRVLFQCGEGTQRLLHEYRVRTGRIRDVLLLHLDAEACGGLLGMLLTLSDAEHGGVRVIGPRGLQRLFRAADGFARRPDYAVTVTEVGGEGDSPVLLIDEPVMRVYGVLLQRNGGWEMGAERYKRPRRGAAPATTPTVRTVGAWGSDVSEEVVNGPTAPTSGAAADAAPPLCLCYVVRVADHRGKFDVERAKAHGVPVGRLFSRLQQGETITVTSPEDGRERVVRPEDVMEPSTPGPTIVLLSCASPDWLTPLLSAETRAALQRAVWDSDAERRQQSRAVCVLHMLCAEAWQDRRYSEWTRDTFGDRAYHAVAGEQLGDVPVVFRSQAAMLERLHRLRPEWFRLPRRGVQGAEGSEVAATLPSSWRVAVPMLRFNLAPPATIGWEVPRRDAETPPPPAAPPPSPPSSAAIDPHYRVLFLGTGSAVPGKYRNVSGILVDLVDSALLLDAGEGTYGQLMRALGAREAQHLLLRKLRCVWISHMHADHHLGLPRLLSRRARLAARSPPPPPPSLLVVGPRALQPWLRSLSQYEPLPFLFIGNHELLHSGAAPIADYLPSTLGVHLRTLPVVHCPDAYAVVIESSTATAAATDAHHWRLVYSGDTLPHNPGIISAASGASLLIHEATFEDAKADEALERRHCTIGQAIETVRQAAPQRAILTHFSQRYAKAPAVDDAQVQRALRETRSLPAWDLMQVPWWRRPEGDGDAAGSAGHREEEVTAFLQELVVEFATELASQAEEEEEGEHRGEVEGDGVQPRAGVLAASE